jgi:hypothetical protein
MHRAALLLSLWATKHTTLMHAAASFLSCIAPHLYHHQEIIMPRQTLTVQLMHANTRIAALETELHNVQSAYTALANMRNAEQLSRSAPSTKPLPTDGQGYWDYVRAVKKWCFANNRPVSYLTQQDWANHFEHA